MRVLLYVSARGKPRPPEIGDFYRRINLYERPVDVLKKGHFELPPLIKALADLSAMKLASSGPPAAIEAVRGWKDFLTIFEAGAAHLFAAYSARSLWEENFYTKALIPLLTETVGPSLPMGGFFSRSGASTSFVEGLSRTIEKARESGAPIYVEIAGGDKPFSLPFAYELSGAMFLAIDPIPLYYSSEDVGRTLSLPPNFTAVSGLAEEAALYAAAEPFADGAVMVAPLPSVLMSMILSALLMVKEGGHVIVVQSSIEDSPLELLRAIGLKAEQYKLRSFDPRIPNSGYIDRDAGAIITVIEVPSMVDEDLPKSFGSVVIEQPNMSEVAKPPSEGSIFDPNIFPQPAQASPFISYFGLPVAR